jgi:hypothetical protein
MRLPSGMQPESLLLLTRQLHDEVAWLRRSVATISGSHRVNSWFMHRTFTKLLVSSRQPCAVWLCSLKSAPRLHNPPRLLFLVTSTFHLHISNKVNDTV